MSERSLQWLLEKIDTSALILPEIQRDFVWKKENVRLLFDSLFRKLPIGYMLIWKSPKAVAHKEFVGKKQIGLGQNITEFYGYLLDGQQRLTAIRMIRDRHDDYPLYFSLKPTNKMDPDQDRFVYGKYGRCRQWHIAVSDILSEASDPWQIARDYQEKEKVGSEEAREIHNDLNRLKDILKYPIGVIEFEHDSLRTATQLFIRFNSTGRKLNRNDLVAAGLSLSAQEIITKRISKLASKYSPRFNFTKPYLIQCLAGFRKDIVNCKTVRTS